MFELGGPILYKGVPIRYLPANIDEQIQALPAVESVDSIAYDDDVRTGERFSFAPVNEPMEIILHVGPEYSWDVLQKFLNEASGRMVSAMYEFHAPHKGCNRGPAAKRYLDDSGAGQCHVR
jgi:hypothetical protein